MAIWISWDIDIGRSMNSRDSFPERKFRNRALTSCSPGPILSATTISFVLHAKTVEIDLEKCNFHNFGNCVTLTLDRVEVTLVHMCGRGLATHQIRWKSEKLFVDGRTDGQIQLSSNLLDHHLLWWPNNQCSKWIWKQVHQWGTDARPRMVSRDPPQPKFTRFGHQVSIGQTPNYAKFRHPATKKCPKYQLWKICALDKVDQSSSKSLKYDMQWFFGC